MMMSPNTLILLMPLLALLRSGARAEMGRRGIRHRVIIGHVQGDALVKRLRGWLQHYAAGTELRTKN